MMSYAASVYQDTPVSEHNPDLSAERAAIPLDALSVLFYDGEAAWQKRRQIAEHIKKTASLQRTKPIVFENRAERMETAARLVGFFLQINILSFYFHFQAFAVAEHAPKILDVDDFSQAYRFFG